jgi:hypothetical protein
MVTKVSAGGSVRRHSPAKRGGLRRVSLLAVAASAIVVVVLLVVFRSHATTVNSTAVESFQAAMKAPVQHWGKIEVYGMRPAMADLRSGTGVGPEAIAEEARAWQRGLADVGRQLDAISAPSTLGQPLSLFKQALAGYVHVAWLVEQAAGAGEGTRQELLSQAVAAAKRADCVYDDGSVQLQSARLAAGLRKTPDFPDHQCAGSGAQP